MEQINIAERERRAAIAALQSFGRWLDEQPDPRDAADEIRRRVVELESLCGQKVVSNSAC